MQQRYIITIVLLAQLVTALLLAQPVQASDTGYVAGSVFIDGNGNDLAEPQEATVPGATVYLRSQTFPALVFSTQANAEGYFVLSTLPFGVYDVWASADDQEGQQRLLTIEVAEVNAQVLIDVPVSDAVAGVSLGRSGTLFLPLVATR